MMGTRFTGLKKYESCSTAVTSYASRSRRKLVPVVSRKCARAYRRARRNAPAIAPAAQMLISP